MIRKRIEETDEDGRKVVTVVEGPEDLPVDESSPNFEEYDTTYASSTPLTGVAGASSMLAWWVGLAGLAVFGLLATRLGFELGDANPTNGFVDFIYDITGPLLQPFQGIADARTLDGGGIFYPETAIAMGIYLVATALTMLALNALAGTFMTADESRTTHTRVHHDRMVRGH